MATRKISDLTLLNAGQVSSSDTLLLLDNSDPTDQNKRSAVGSIFTAVPSGTYTAPGVRFEGKTATGVFSETQGQVGLAMGNARLNLQKVGTTLNIQARDDADTNLDFTISAQGTGKIRLGSILAVNDLNFVVPNSIDETKVARFSSANLTAGLTNIYSFPSNEGLTNTTDELATLKATQTLENKTLVSPTFTGSLAIESFVSSGNATIGDAAADSLTVNAAATFASSTTFANSVVMNQGATVTGNVDLTGKFKIPSSGITITDDANGIYSWNGNGGFIQAGTSDTNCLQIFHDVTSNNSFISEVGVGDLSIVSNGTNVYIQKDATPGSAEDMIHCIANGAVKLFHDNVERLTTSATGISIGGAIDNVTSITSTGDIAVATDKFTLDSTNGNAVFGGSVTCAGNIQTTAGDTFQLGSTSAAKLGIGRAASTYNLEVEGSIYSTGSTIIAGNGTAGKFILQKGAGGIGLHFTDNTGTDQAVLDGAGNFGIGKSPTQKFDVSGNARIDGDITIITTNPTTSTGGKISAREIVLTDPTTGATVTLDSLSGSGVSRGRVYFLSN